MVGFGGRLGFGSRFRVEFLQLAVGSCILLVESGAGARLGMLADPISFV